MQLLQLSKQLFKTRIINNEAITFSINRSRLTPDRFVQTILESLQQQFEQRLEEQRLEDDQ